MLQSYSESVAPGTLANRSRQAKLYVKFSVLYDVNPLAPSETEICMYAQYLKNLHLSPQTVKNYISGAKTWIAEHGGSITSFLGRELDQLTKGFTKNSDHVPSRAAPLSVTNLFTMAKYVKFHPCVPCSVLPCIVIGFKCFLRSSNLLSPSTLVWGGPHTLLARDIVNSENGLRVTVSATKTKRGSEAETFYLDKEDDPRICPVHLWNRYITLVKPWALGPAFLTDNYLPLTARHVVGVMRAALADSKDLDPGKVSMQSLRRGAAQDAMNKGLSLPLIKTFGLWKSDSGVKPYLERPTYIFKH